MKNYSNLAVSFLQIILWFSLISASLGILVTVLCFASAASGFDFAIVSNIKITVGGVKISFEQLKYAGLFSFAVFGILAISYLGLFIRLSSNALNVLNKVNLKNPFNEEVSYLISKLGTTALFLGILNIFSPSVLSLLYRGQSVLDFNFENFNFLIMAAILYIVSLIFKRGTELQSENDLTI